ncbi:MAG: ABC transporter permease [Planctomycetota bacterium]|nr:ABC transporter permease [Planctomycetota bacterium]MDE2215760.1 ABC transporter permease [Planctomycetota bacterium]
MSSSGNADEFNMLKHFKRLLSYHELLINITLRDVKARYKQSLLGTAWAVIHPLSLMLIFTVVFSKFLKVQTYGVPYPIFAYCSLLPWSFFASSLTFAIPSLINNSNLITKIYFPREIFPIAAVMACFLDFLVAGILFVFMMFYYHINISWHILLVPFIIFIQILFTIGVAFFASAVIVFLRDIRYIVPLGLQLWMFLTPVVYPTNIVPARYLSLYMLNPMAGIIDSYRRVILYGESPNITYLGIAFLISVFSFYLAYCFFKKVEMKFADVI